jgi:hypothetical protein
MQYQIIPASEIKEGDLVVNFGVVDAIEVFTMVARIKFRESTKLSLQLNPWEMFGKDMRLTIIR